MNKPVIGLIPLVDSQRDSYWMLPGYMRGILDAGGVPVMLPLTDGEDALDTMLAFCDGFLFTGGHDVDPSLYNQENHGLCGELAPGRDSMEWVLLGKALEQGKAVLGICRGLQFLNVRLGGTLYQDLPAQFPSPVNHRQPAPYHLPIHPVRLSGPLAQALDRSEISVNSCHHQAIRDLAPGLTVMAQAPDGLVEAVCMADKPFVWAVQWHPEFFSADDPVSHRIFRSFVEGCQKSSVKSR